MEVDHSDPVPDCSVATETPAFGNRFWQTNWSHIIAILVIVGGIYGLRLSMLPLHGEESRWAQGAAQMLQTGDWIVPRQQGEVFPERPPLNSWAMAAAATLWGELDETAVRLPSVIAMMMTTLLVFVYTRSFLPIVGSVVAAGAFATMGQVLQIGRLGESESIFTFFVAASLLLWHLGYTSKWPSVLMWCVAYGLAALGALTKGIQAPVYLVAVVGMFLLIKRDWKTAFSWSHLVGIISFVTIVGAWQIPFYMQTQWDDVVAIWLGLASDRVAMDGLLQHLAAYPVETLICLLPWSILLMQLIYAPLRRSLKTHSNQLLFLLLPVFVTYPSVWFSIGARGRYFMPLYPCIAVVIGMIVQHTVQAAESSGVRRGWNRFLSFCATLAVGLAITVAVAWFVPSLADLQQSIAATFFVIVLTCSAAAIMFWARRDVTRALPAVYSLIVFLGVAYTGVAVSARAKSRADLDDMVTTARKVLPSDQDLVSFGAISHRFCYYYRDPISQLPWPEDSQQLPENIEYFCFQKRPGDTPELRLEGRGRSWSTTSGTLPFRWEEAARVSCESRIGKNQNAYVVIGRIIREPTRVAAEKETKR